MVARRPAAPRACRSARSPPPPARACASSRSRWPGGRGGARRRARGRADPAGDQAGAGRRAGLRARQDRRTTASCPRRASRAAGSCRPTSATTRRSATWPTGWPGSASRRRWPRLGAAARRRGADRRGRRRGRLRLGPGAACRSIARGEGSGRARPVRSPRYRPAAVALTAAARTGLRPRLLTPLPPGPGDRRAVSIAGSASQD